MISEAARLLLKERGVEIAAKRRKAPRASQVEFRAVDGRVEARTAGQNLFRVIAEGVTLAGICQEQDTGRFGFILSVQGAFETGEVLIPVSWLYGQDDALAQRLAWAGVGISNIGMLLRFLKTPACWPQGELRSVRGLPCRVFDPLEGSSDKGDRAFRKAYFTWLKAQQSQAVAAA